ELVEDGAWFDQRWIANEQRNADGLFISETALDAEAMLAVEVAMVARENDHGVIELAGGPQGVKNLADAFLGGHEQPHAVVNGFVIGGSFRLHRRNVVDFARQCGLVARWLKGVWPARRRVGGVHLLVALGGNKFGGIRITDAAIGPLFEI